MSIRALVPLALTFQLQLCLAPMASAEPPPADAPPQQAAPRSIPTVSLDPEHPLPILGWWSNGAQMLEVAEDGAYRLYDSTNRYRKPLEVGRWHRQNHAAFWLEPYTMRKEDRSRVPLSILDERPVISVRKYAPMAFIEEPPLSAEDLFIGLWQGDGGTLELLATMRYHYVAPKAAGVGQPVVISSHRGEWRLNDGRVELLPDSPSVTALLLEPESDDEQTTKDATKQPTKTSPPHDDAKSPQSEARHGSHEANDHDAPASAFTRLRGVEGVLHRIVERPSVGPDGERHDPAHAPSKRSDAPGEPSSPAKEHTKPVTNPSR